MRIGIDARAYQWTGIGRYVRNLLRQVTGLVSNLPPPWDAVEFVVLVPAPFAEEIRRLPRTRVLPVRDSYYSLYEQTGFLRVARAARVDLMHFPNFNGPILYRSPSVVTLHDLTRFRFPSTRRLGPLHQWAYAMVFRAAVQHAQRIIAVSQFTKDEVLRRFPRAAKKVSVVYEGVEERFFEPLHAGVSRDRSRGGWAVGYGDDDALRQLGVSRPYLLYVGLWMQHKNLPGLFRAFRLVRAAGYPGALVITGEGRPWDEDVQRLAERAGVAPQVLRAGRVDDQALAALYRQADALVYPSFSEGFGLPPLEAMASGTPVVAARAGSLPEVLGDAALFANPDHPEEIAEAVRLLLADRGLRERLVARGAARAAQFSWAQCAWATLAVYAQALGIPKPAAEHARLPEAHRSTAVH